jgi:uncharacterized protein
VSAAAARSCGECSSCCRLLEITVERAPGFEKPAGEWCKHCVKPGCGIYASRPQLCKDFRCLWLDDERLGPEWRPDVSGLILVWQPPGSLFVVCDPDRPDAWREPPYRATIERMSLWGLRGPTKFEVRITEASESIK